MALKITTISKATEPPRKFVCAKTTIEEINNCEYDPWCGEEPPYDENDFKGEVKGEVKMEAKCNFNEMCRPYYREYQIWKRWVTSKDTRNEGMDVVVLVDFMKDMNFNEKREVEKLAVLCKLWILPTEALDDIWDGEDSFIKKNGCYPNVNYAICFPKNFAPTQEMIREKDFGSHSPRIFSWENIPPLFEPPTDMMSRAAMCFGYTVSTLVNEWRKPEYTWSDYFIYLNERMGRERESIRELAFMEHNKNVEEGKVL